MKKHTDISRRRFLGSSALLSGAALGASQLTLAATGMNHQGKKKVIKKAPLFDLTLENYPGYSAYIPVPDTSEAETDKGEGDSLFTAL